MMGKKGMDAKDIIFWIGLILSIILIIILLVRSI